MAEREMTVTIIMREDTAENWASKNPVLNSSEFGRDTTNNILKVGDGSTAWADLPEVAFSGSSAAAYAVLASEAETAAGYTAGGATDKRFKEIESRLTALEEG